MQAFRTISLALAAMLALSIAAPATAQATKVASTWGVSPGGQVVSASGATVKEGDITFTAANQSVVIDAAGAGGVSLQAAGTWSGTIQLQSSDKPASGFAATSASSSAADTTTSPNIGANGQYFGNPKGRYLKLTTTSWTSGQAVITPYLHLQRFPGAGGGGGGGGGGDVTAQIGAFVDGYSSTDGKTDDTACATDNGTCTTQALVKRLNQRVTSLISSVQSAIPPGLHTTLIGGVSLYLGASEVTAGQKTKSASIPVVLPSDQTAVAGSASLAVAQVSVTTSATQIAAARTGRSTVTVVNGGTNDVFLGGSGVTTSTGVLLLGVKGASVTLPFSGAVYGISSATSAVSVAETY